MDFIGRKIGGRKKKKLDACKRKINATLQFAYLSRCQNRWSNRATKPKDTKVVPPAVAATHRSFYVSRATLSGGEGEERERKREKKTTAWAARQALHIKQFHWNDSLLSRSWQPFEKKKIKKNYFLCDNNARYMYNFYLIFRLKKKKLVLERGANIPEFSSKPFFERINRV